MLTLGYAQCVKDNLISVKVAHIGEPAYLRMARVHEGNVNRELHLRVQGFVVQSTLPPITDYGE